MLFAKNIEDRPDHAQGSLSEVSLETYSTKFFPVRHSRKRSVRASLGFDISSLVEATAFLDKATDHNM